MITSKDFMLCDSRTEEEVKIIPNKQDYTANIKYDGCRVIAVINNGKVVLLNRHGGICNNQFGEVVDDLKTMPNGVYDGEVISLDDNFNQLQRRAGTKDPNKISILRKQIPVKYMIFDIIHNGTTLAVRHLKDRIVILKNVFSTYTAQKFYDDERKERTPFVEMAEYGDINTMLEKAHTEDREGIIVKFLNGFYEGKRSPYWIKCKFFLETTINVCKYEENPKGITAEDKEGNRVLVAGNQSLEVKQLIDIIGEVTINIQYLEKTKEGRYRFPSYRGLVK